MVSGVCPACDESFESEYGMKIHYGQKHEGSLAGVEKTCANCDSKTNVLPENARRNERCFCDKSCHGEWLSDNNVGENHVNFDSLHVECGYCGRGLIRQRHKVESSDNVFCDNQCRGSWVSENMSGTDSPLFEGGEQYYGENWQEKREQAIERDFYKCRMCRLSNTECLEEYGCELHVHHKIPLRQFETPEKANRLWNLISLCPSCHQMVESRAQKPQSVANNEC